VRNLLFIFTLFLLSSNLLLAQNGTDEKLARQYLQNKEFDKALDLYEKLYDSKGGSIFYDEFLGCLMELQKYAEAEKLVKKQLKQNQYDNPVLIDLGYVFLMQNEKEIMTTTTTNVEAMGYVH
jgi:tetratricopeptide (TPR) repeat protein